MTLSRMPIFAWALLVFAFMILFAFTPLIIGSLLLELDRGFGTQFFNPAPGRQLPAVAAPVLDLRAPGGLHPVRAGHRASSR